MTYLYVHTVPNGKRYIGIAENCEERWENGNGYKYNEDFYRDIKFYGWDNIKHEIIDCFEDRNDAEHYECIYIIMFNTENNNCGYNQTKYKEKFTKKYLLKTNFVSNEKKKRKTYKEYTSEEQDTLTKFNMPWSALNCLIKEWIFNDKHRNILKRKLYDGFTFNQIANEFNLSIQQTKAIFYKCEKELLKHI